MPQVVPLTGQPRPINIGVKKVYSLAETAKQEAEWEASRPLPR